MSKSFYLFYNDKGELKEVGRVSTDDTLHSYEIDRQTAVDFLQGNKKFKDYEISLDGTSPALEEIKKVKAAASTNFNFMFLEDLQSNKPEIDIEYDRVNNLMKVTSNKPLERGTNFYITKKNDPTQVYAIVECAKGSSGGFTECEKYPVSVISWGLIGKEVNYSENK